MYIDKGDLKASMCGLTSGGVEEEEGRSGHTKQYSHYNIVVVYICRSVMRLICF